MCIDTTQLQTIPFLLIMTVFMGTLLFIVLVSCLPIIACYCHMRRKMRQLTVVQQWQQELSPTSPEIASQGISTIPQPPEYEDIQELQGTKNTDPSTNSVSRAPAKIAGDIFTKCPAYGQVVQIAGEKSSAVPLPTSSQHQTPEYEDNEHTQSTSPPSGVAPCYSMTQCPAYYGHDTKIETLMDPSPHLLPSSPRMPHNDLPNPHEYEDIEGVQPDRSTVRCS